MDELRTLVARQQIADTVTDLFVGTDNRDWSLVLRCFADQVLFDMRSLTGAEPATVAATHIVAGWQTGLAPLKAVHHQIGNLKVEVDDETARAFCYGTATHYLPNPSGRNTRTFVGSYDFRLKKDGAAWRITDFRFNAKYVDGNLELEHSG